MSDILILLLSFGPVIALSCTLSGILIPGSMAVGIFSITRYASLGRNLAFGGLCLALTMSFLVRSAGDFALFMAATALPFAIHSLAAVVMLRWLKGFDQYLEQRGEAR